MIKIKKYISFILLLMFIIQFSGCKSHKKTRREKVKTHIKTRRKRAKSGKATLKKTHGRTNAKKTRLEKIFRKYKGVRYRYGGTSSKGFDCSGFTQKVYLEAFKKKLPRTTKSMMKIGKKVSKHRLKIGDLVFFHPTRRYYHVGIYMGENTFIHASTSRGVMKSNLNHAYWKKHYIFARRIL